MTWNVRKTLLGIVISTVILLAVFGLGLIPLNLFFLKTTISETILDKTGVELTLEGPLRLRLGPRPKLTAREVMIQWPDDSRPLSATIRTVSVQSRLASVVRGNIDLSSVTAHNIVIDPGSGEFGDILPKNLHLEAAAPLNEAMNVHLEGQFRGEPWALSLLGDSLERLLAATQEYSFQVRLSAPGSGVEFDGALLLPWDRPGITGQVTVQSAELSALLLQLGQELPGLGQLSLQAGLRLNESTVQLDGLEGKLDDFAFKLWASARDWSTRPFFDIKAHVPLVDPAFFQNKGMNAANTDQDAPLDLQPLYDLLAAFDGQAEITIGQVQLTDFPVRDLAVSAALDNGFLNVKDARASISGTGVSAQATLDTLAACARLETSLRVPETDLATVTALLERENRLEGRLRNGWSKTGSCGASPEQHLKSLETAFTIETLELIGDDDQQSLRFTNIDAAVNWQQGGRVSFESELNGEPLTFSARFGSVEQLTSDELWPIELQARTNSIELEFSGQTATHETGLILDLSLAARLGGSDIRGQLAWSGFESGLPLIADLRSNLLNLDDLEILLLDDAQQDSVSIQDWSNLLDDSELLENWHTAPSIDVKLAIDQLEGTPYEIGRLGLDAHLEDRQLADGRMSLDFEGVEMDGLINADMSQPTALFDYRVALKNLDVGRLMKSMNVSDTVDARAERAEIHLNSEGATLRELGREMRADVNLRSLQYSFTAGPENRPFDINLSDVSMIAAPGSDIIWETRGTLNGFPLEAWLKTPNLRATFNENVPLPARFILASRDDIMMFDLTVHPESAAGRLSEILISGRYSSEDKVDFAALPSPLEDYSFSTDLTTRGNVYQADNINVRLGSSHATGSFDIEPSGEGFHFELVADSPFLETDDLVRWVAEFRESRDAISGPETAAVDDAPVNVGLLTLINRYADEFVGENSWDVSATIGELRSAGRLLGETELGLRMDGHEFILDPATIRFPGGNVSTRYSSIQEGSGWDSNLDIFIERLEYGGLVRLFDPEATAGGVIHMDTSLHSRSMDPESAVDHLEGTFDLAVFPDNVGAEFLDLWASNLVFALLPLGDSQQKKLNCLVARFEVENGVMTSRETFLDSTEIIVRARGDIDLSNRQLDMLAVPQAKTEKFLSISTPIQVKGSFDDYSVGVASGGFVMTMLRWYYGLIYVPWKWLTGERFPADGIATCFNAMDWELPEE